MPLEPTALSDAEPAMLSIAWLPTPKYAPTPNLDKKYLVYALNGKIGEYFIARYMTIDGENIWVIPHGYKAQYYGEVPQLLS